MKKALENPEMIFENRRRNLDDFFKNKIPGLETNLEYLKKIYYFCNYVSWSNVYDFKEGNFKNPYTCPSKFRLLPQWFWDSTFHSIYEKYRMIDCLVYLKIPGESGWDNSRRYIPELPFVQKNSPMIKENRYIVSPDFKHMFTLGRFLIKKMAEELNKEEIYKEYEIRGKELKKKNRNFMG